MVTSLLAMQETQVQSLGLEDPLEKENGNPLQYSCMENPMDRGAWQATGQGVAKELDTTEATQHVCMRLKCKYQKESQNYTLEYYLAAIGFVT